jgi:SAM-dependent methyltransferase
VSQDEDLLRRVRELDWYHTLRLPGGIVTPGFFDHSPVLSRYGLPDDLRGHRVLDVGTFDGFFAFEFERRGASEVVGIDVPDARSLDWPAPLRRKFEHPRFQPKRANFELAREALGSRAEYASCSVYDVGKAGIGTFDYVFCGSVLAHLRDPVGALMAMRNWPPRRASAPGSLSSPGSSLSSTDSSESSSSASAPTGSTSSSAQAASSTPLRASTLEPINAFRTKLRLDRRQSVLTDTGSCSNLESATSAVFLDKSTFRWSTPEFIPPNTGSRLRYKLHNFPWIASYGDLIAELESACAWLATDESAMVTGSRSRGNE